MGKQIDISNSDFEDSWHHKWIMLFINRKLKDDQKPDKNKLCKLLRYSSNLIPTYLRFLPEVDLSNSNLLGTNLRFAKLSKANLLKANLQSTDLSGANLSGANLSNADISFCDLVGCNLSEANLYQVNLKGSTLIGADFSNANLSGANLELTNMYQANFSNCVLIGINIRHEIYSEWIKATPVAMGYVFEQPILFPLSADFSNAVIDNVETVKYLRMSGAINVPDAVTDKNTIRKLFRDRGIPYDEE